MSHISVSELMTYWECPRRWRLNLDYRSPQSKAQVRGDWVHAYIEAMYNGTARPGWEEVEEAWASRVGEALLESRGRWWLDGLDPEYKLVLPLLENVEVRARLDGLTHDDGCAIIQEIKYSDRPPDIAKPFQSPQALLYAAILQRAQPDIKTCTARYILVGPEPAEAQGKRRSGAYKVEVVDRPLHNTDQWWAWAQQAAREMEAARALPFPLVRPTQGLHCNWCANGDYFKAYCQPLELFGTPPVQYRAAEEEGNEGVSV